MLREFKTKIEFYAKINAKTVINKPTERVREKIQSIVSSVQVFHHYYNCGAQPFRD